MGFLEQGLASLLYRVIQVTESGDKMAALEFSSENLHILISIVLPCNNKFISRLGKQRQDDCRLEASLDYIMR